MAFNDSLWTEAVTQSSIPNWPCPSCGRHLVAHGVPKFHEQASSEANHGHEDFDPDWIREIFSGQAACSACKDRVLYWGTSSFEPDEDPEGGLQLMVRAPLVVGIFPAPPMISLPPKCPTPVSNELRKAFSLYWSDPSSALNRIRCAVERLCDWAGVRQRQWVQRRNGGKKELRRVNLHQRIQELPPRFTQVSRAFARVEMAWQRRDA